MVFMQMMTSASVYPWVEAEHMWFRGFLYLDKAVLKGHQAIQYIKNRLISNSLDELLPTLNGRFAFILTNEKGIFLVVDRVRSFPIYFTVLHDKLCVSDNVWSLYEANPNLSLCDKSLDDYKTNELFVVGGYTLFEQVKQVRASAYVSYDRASRETKTFFYFRHDHDVYQCTTTSLYNDFKDTYNKIGDNLITALNGRPAIVPLSGGSDSRMIVTLLKERDYNNVLCYTYGRKNNKEMNISREVAKKMGYKWIFIPYSRKEIRNLRKNEQFNSYLIWAGGASTPHIQDFLAVKRLIDENKIPEEAVFVPGHTGDLVSGGHIIDDELALRSTNWEDCLPVLNKKFYKSRALSPNLLNRLQESYRDLFEGFSEPPSALEWFNILERQAKFIVHSIRLYEFFGYEWLIPLWDNEIFEFWKTVPLPLRYRRRLYLEYTEDGIPSTSDENFLTKIRHTIYRSSLLTSAARYFSKPVKYFSSDLLLENFYSFPEYIRMCLKKDEYLTYHTLVHDWYLFILQERMKESIEKQQA